MKLMAKICEIIIYMDNCIMNVRDTTTQMLGLGQPWVHAWNQSWARKNEVDGKMAMTQTKWRTSSNQMEARQNKDSNKIIQNDESM
jgi:hypothetical protein